MRSLLPRFAALALVSTVAVATPAAAEWREASTEHFLIYADADDDWLRSFADRLERVDSAVRVINRIPVQAADRSNRVIVYVLPDVAAVQELAGPTSQAGGFYIPRLGNSLAFVARTVGSSRTRATSDNILFHEYAHHLMWRNAAVSYPMWLSEGFAEMNATAAVTADGGVQIGRAAQYRAQRMVDWASISVEQLLAPPKVLDWDLFYGRAWLLVHMLTFDASRSGQLDRYIALLAKGRPTLDTAREAFGDLRKLNRDLDLYTGKPLMARTVPAARIRTAEVKTRALGPGEAAIVDVRMRSARGVNAAMAKRVLVDARRRAAPFPNDPAVQAALAEAEYDAGNDAEADAAADRAISADAKNQQALVHKAMVATRLATKAKTKDAATWRTARGWYIKAAQADPDAALPLSQFYDTCAAQGVTPTANATEALMKAFILSPQDRGLRMRAARQLLVDGKLPEARAALVPLAFDSHSRGQSDYAARLVEMIDTGAPAATIAAEKPKSAAGEKAADEDDDAKKDE